MLTEERLLARIDGLIAKAEQVIATHQPNPPNFIGFPTLSDEVFAEWQTQVLNLLSNLVGGDHIYARSFQQQVLEPHVEHVQTGRGILRAVRQDVEGGYLTDIRTLVSAEVFTDFLDMAQHLLENEYIVPAASLCGAVLEDGLRQIARKAGLSVRSREDLSSLNSRCAQKGLYSTLVQKRLQVWIDVRNKADHGEFDQVRGGDVAEMHRGVSGFLADYLR